MTNITNWRRLAVDAATLQSPSGRIVMFVMLSLMIFVAPYSWLGHLSLWQALGWERAPSIGLTRAYWLLIHGKPAAAWDRNWLIYVVLAVGLPLIIRDILTVVRHTDRALTVRNYADESAK